MKRPVGRPAHLLACVRCLEEKPKKAFPNMGRVCSTCRNQQTIASRDEYRIRPADELARLKLRVKPSAEELVVVQRAADRIRDYLFQKIEGATSYTGETAWAVVEAYTKDNRRFHQLLSLASLQQQVWEESRAGNLRIHGRRVPEADVLKIRGMKKDKLTITNIAARTGYPIPTVSKILRRLTEPTTPVPSENEPIRPADSNREAA